MTAVLNSKHKWANMSSTNISKEVVALEERPLSYTCEECNVKTTSKTQMDKHVKSEHLPFENEEVIYTCTKCKHDFKEADDYNSHVQEHENPPTNQDEQVPSQLEEDELEFNAVKNIVFFSILDHFIESPDMNENFEKVNEELFQEFSSDLNCSELPTNTSDFLVELTCRLCIFEGETKADMATHMETKHEAHLKKRMDAFEFKCHLCVYEANNTRDIDTHGMLVHGILSCGRCDYLAGDRDIMRKHMETHSGSSILPCRICEFETTRKSTLDNHFKSKHCQDKTISVDDYHQCKKCNKRFLGMFALTNHKCGLHSEKKKNIENKCLACNYTSATEDELKMHIVSAHAFPCEVCKVVFSNPGDLNNHVMTHEIEQGVPLELEKTKCDQCDFETNMVKEFVTHLLEKHRNEDNCEYKCSFCEFRTNVKENLDSHIVNYHDVIGVLNGLAENQMNISQSIGRLKEEVVNALSKIIEDNNILKQELFILRQSNHNQTPLAAQNSSQPKVSAPRSPPSQSSTTTPPIVSTSRPAPPSMSTSMPAPAPAPVSTPVSKMQKILLVGDSISGQLHLKTIETATMTEVRAVKAYSSIHENIEEKGKHAPRFPTKNFNDVIAKELTKEQTDVLMVQSGSVDITNLKTDGDLAENTEYFKQQTIASANNLFMSVSNAVANHPNLKKVIILKQVPRYDAFSSTIPGLKPFLAKLYNDTVDQLGAGCSFKDKLVIGNHTLDCSGGVMLARYKDIKSGRFDGVHLYGPSGQKAYTESIMQILNLAQLVKVNPPKYYEEYDHQTCSQANYQNKLGNKRHQTKTKRSRHSRNITSRSTVSDYQYSVPTQNRYAKLGDFFPKN